MRFGLRGMGGNEQLKCQVLGRTSLAKAFVCLNLPLSTDVSELIRISTSSRTRTHLRNSPIEEMRLAGDRFDPLAERLQMPDDTWSIIGRKMEKISQSKSRSI